MYDKHENTLDGGSDGGLIGNDPGAHPIKTEVMREATRHIPGGSMGLYGIEGIIKTIAH